MNATIELVLSSGAREPASPCVYSGRGALLLILRAQLQAVRSRRDVVAAVARDEAGGEVRVDRVRAAGLEKAEPGI